jgi:hypothetical protein
VRLDAEAKKLAETEQGTEDGNGSVMEDAKRAAGDSILEQDLSGAAASAVNQSAAESAVASKAKEQMNASQYSQLQKSALAGGATPADRSSVAGQEEPKAEADAPEQAAAEDEVHPEEPELLDGTLFANGVDMTKGAKLTFTFEEGLVVSI